MRGGTHVVASAIVALLVFTAASPLPSWAADRYWKSASVGGSEDAPYDIWDTANWDGAVGSGNHLHFSVSEKTYIKSTSSQQVGNDLDVDSGDFVFIGPLKFLAFKNTTANATVNIVKKGDWEIYNYEFWGGSGDGVHLTFTNESGNLTKTGSSGQTIFLAEGANSEVEFYHRAGTMTAAKYGIILGRKTAKRAYLEISGGTVKNTAGNISICEITTDEGTGEVKVTGGELLAEAGSVIVGVKGRGTLNVDGGVSGHLPLA